MAEEKGWSDSSHTGGCAGSQVGEVIRLYRGPFRWGQGKRREGSEGWGFDGGVGRRIRLCPPHRRNQKKLKLRHMHT